MNLHYGLVRTSKLTEDGIEGDPGIKTSRNYAIKKAVHAPHHQGEAKYAGSACMQVIAMHTLQLFSSFLRILTFGNHLVLIMFLNHGDRAFKDVDMNQPIAADKLPPHVCIEGTQQE